MLQDMAAAAKAVSPKPFIAAAVPGRTLGKVQPLVPLSGRGGDSAGSGSSGGAATRDTKAAAQVKAWRSPGPPKKVRTCWPGHVALDGCCCTPSAL